MISYFAQNKGKLNLCEDSLTSGVFDILKYLPTDIFWRILKRSLYHDDLPNTSGDLLKISFWDKWGAKNTSNTKFVEPDIFLRFEKFDIIIEAKAKDENQQYYHQRKNQVIAYCNEFGEEKKEKLFYIELGGLQNKDKEEKHKSCGIIAIICKTDWTKLLDSIVEEKHLIEHEEYPNNQLKRMLNDLITVFELHQFYKKLWLDSICKKDINIDSSFKINHFYYEKRS